MQRLPAAPKGQLPGSAPRRPREARLAFHNPCVARPAPPETPRRQPVPSVPRARAAGLPLEMAMYRSFYDAGAAQMNTNRNWASSSESTALKLMGSGMAQWCSRSRARWRYTIQVSSFDATRRLVAR